jgi:hypothetical protein
MPRKRKLKDENITYTLHDKETSGENSIDTDTLLKDFSQLVTTETYEEDECEMMDDYCLAQLNDYELNYTTKQMMTINDYYKLGNTSKLKKIDIIERIVEFENDKNNNDIVSKRQTLWFYLQELKSDPFTKKFIWAP